MIYSNPGAVHQPKPWKCDACSPVLRRLLTHHECHRHFPDCLSINCSSCERDFTEVRSFPSPFLQFRMIPVWILQLWFTVHVKHQFFPSPFRPLLLLVASFYGVLYTHPSFPLVWLHEKPVLFSCIFFKKFRVMLCQVSLPLNLLPCCYSLRFSLSYHPCLSRTSKCFQGLANMYLLLLCVKHFCCMQLFLIPRAGVPLPHKNILLCQINNLYPPMGLRELQTRM
jgi:hypothetical protein